MNSRNRSYAIYILLFLAIISMVYFNMQQQALETRVIPINQLAADIEAGKVSKVTALENNLTIAYKDGTNKEATLDSQSGLVEQLVQLGVSTRQLQDPGLELVISKPGMLDTVLNILVYILPFLFMLGIFLFFIRQAQGSNNSAIALSKSRARMVSG